MALARALAVAPKVLLLDEPFGALDANVRTELRRWLRRLHDEQGVTTVLVTHDQEEAMEVADTIAVLNEGLIEQVGSPRDVYDHPVNDFVMGFLGPAIRVDGRLVRPHDVEVSLEPSEDALEAMVRRVVHLGFEVRVELDLPDGSPARAQLTRSQTAQLELARGDIVYVRVPSGARRASRRRRSARDPGLRVVGELVDPGGKLAARQVRERDRLNDRAEVVANGDPDAGKRLGGTLV